MVKSYSLLIVSLTAVSLSVHADITYDISGDVDGIDGKAIYVFDYSTRKNIDSVKVENGHFALKGTYGRKALVRVESGNTFSNCILDDTPVTLDFDSHCPASGSDINMEYRALWTYNKDFEKEYDSRYAKLKEAGIEGDSLGAAVRQMYDEMMPAYKERYRRTMVDNFDNGLSEAALMTYSNYCTPDEWEKLWEQTPEANRKLRLFSEVNDRFCKMRLTAEGRQFVDISGSNTDGTPVRLSDYVGRGKYVLVDFWASWCGPCIAEGNSTLKPLYEKYKDNPRFEILGVVTWDDSEKSVKAIEKHGYGWPQMVGTGMTPMREYGFESIPMIILFGPDGTILYRDLRGDRLTSTIDKLLCQEFD